MCPAIEIAERHEIAEVLCQAPVSEDATGYTYKPAATCPLMQFCVACADSERESCRKAARKACEMCGAGRSCKVRRFSAPARLNVLRPDAHRQTQEDGGPGAPTCKVGRKRS